MGVFTERELAYLLGERRLARLATVGRDGMPHVAPVGWSWDGEREAVEVRGYSMAETKKFRDVRATGRAALVIDDVLPPWRPRGVEVRGRAEAVNEPGAVIRIYPERVVSWGLESGEMGDRQARSVGREAADAGERRTT